MTHNAKASEIQSLGKVRVEMDVKDAVNLYREVLYRYSRGFFMEELLGGIADALEADTSILFLLKESSRRLESCLLWGLDEPEREQALKASIPYDDLATFAETSLTTLDAEYLRQWGLEFLLWRGEGVSMLMPIRFGSAIHAALIINLRGAKMAPSCPPIRIAAVQAILEIIIEFFFSEKMEISEMGKERREAKLMELDLLSNYLMHNTDYLQATSLSLDLLIKLFGMDGGTVHYIEEGESSDFYQLIASREWSGMMDIVEHLFENNLIGLLKFIRGSDNGNLCLDAKSITKYFPGVNPYLHAHNIKSFLLTPLFKEEKLVGVLSLFGKSYAALDEKDIELLVQLTDRLGNLFAEMKRGERVENSDREGWKLLCLVENLGRLFKETDDLESFLSSSLQMIAGFLDARMAFLYFNHYQHGYEKFCWHGDALWGDETAPPLSSSFRRILASTSQITLVKTESSIMDELPGAHISKLENLVALLVPARDKKSLLVMGLYLPRDQRIQKEFMESLSPLATLIFGMLQARKDNEENLAHLRPMDLFQSLQMELSACEDERGIIAITTNRGREMLNCEAVGMLIMEEGGGFQGHVETGDGVGKADLLLVANQFIAEAMDKSVTLQLGAGDEEVALENKETVTSALVVPLTGRRERLGALIFQKRKAPFTFTNFQKKLAECIAARVAIALEVMRETKRIKAHSAEDGKLLEISKLLQSFKKMEDLGAGLQLKLRALADVDFLYIWISLGDKPQSWAWRNAELYGLNDLDELFKPDSPLSNALTRGEMITCEDFPDLTYKLKDKVPFARELRLCYAFPLKEKDKFLGALLVGKSNFSPFSPEEINLLKKLAAFLAPIVTNLCEHESMEREYLQLKEGHRELEETLQAKTDLLNIASHEVRHPLTLITGFSEVLRDYYESMSEQERKDVAEKLIRAGDRLRRSVVNMMEVSQLESGKLSIHLEEVNLSNLLQCLTEELKVRSSDIFINGDVRDDAEKIIADRDKLEVILFNLVDNAAKYSPAGSTVNISARRSNGEAILTISDQGRGIREDQLDSIFQPFNKGEGEERGSIKGMGLGLYIVRKLVEAHGGRITVHSKLGEGTIFSIFLPQPPGNQQNEISSLASYLKEA